MDPEGIGQKTTHRERVVGRARFYIIGVSILAD